MNKIRRISCPNMETVFPAKAQRVASASNASRFIPFLATDRICDFHGGDPQDVTSCFFRNTPDLWWFSPNHSIKLGVCFHRKGSEWSEKIYDHLALNGWNLTQLHRSFHLFKEDWGRRSLLRVTVPVTIPTNQQVFFPSQQPQQLVDWDDFWAVHCPFLSVSELHQIIIKSYPVLLLRYPNKI